MFISPFYVEFFYKSVNSFLIGNNFSLIVATGNKIMINPAETFHLYSFPI